MMPKKSGESINWKLWIYTNYDCHLRCSYCVAESSPEAERREIELETVKQLVDEAKLLGFEEVFFTGGEPFILDEIYEMLDYASQQMRTTVLTTGMMLKGKRLEKLNCVEKKNLTLQVSLDGGRAEHHDAYRGKGTWLKTVESIQRLQEFGYRVKLSTTETPANSTFLDEICNLHNSFGIPEKDHLVRPLAKRGFSSEGISVGMSNIQPEITVNKDGIFWHPLSTDTDMQVSKSIFPLAEAVETIRQQLEVIAAGGEPQICFT